jgi:rSAM/selenodomain-associated transferase 1
VLPGMVNRSATHPVLVIMARAPLPGQVKTRLIPSLSPEQCAELYRAMLEDTLAMAASVPLYLTYLAFTPSEQADLFRSLVAEGITMLQQRGDNLGHRMANAVRELETKYSPVVIIGSDLPTLQPEALLQALKELETKDLCLGPTSDGGYYLVGLRRGCGVVFEDIPWSTPDVLATTLRRAEAAGLSVALLHTLGDVDVIEDVAGLETEINRLKHQSGAVIPVQTLDWLQRHEGLFRQAPQTR